MMYKKMFVTFILFFLSFIPTSEATINSLRLKAVSVDSFLGKNLSISTIHRLGETIILPEGPFDEAEVMSIISRLDQLPVSLLKKIRENKIKLTLLNGKITDHPSAKSLTGKIPRGYENKKLTWDDLPGVGGTKDVLVKIGFSEKGSGHGSVNLELHELAHSIDRYVYNEIHKRKDYIAIWEAERGGLFPYYPYFLNYPEEYFAETFAMFYLNIETNEYLKTFAPLSYAFIEGLH